MARPLRIELPGATYHVMNRGSARQRTFREDYQRFLQTLTETHAWWGVEVFAYSLLGTHYQVCLRTPAGNLARGMRHLDGLYTQRFNRTAALFGVGGSGGWDGRAMGSGQCWNRTELFRRR